MVLLMIPWCHLYGRIVIATAWMLALPVWRWVVILVLSSIERERAICDEKDYDQEQKHNSHSLEADRFDEAVEDFSECVCR